MPENKTYSRYFDIDPDFSPIVNNDFIGTHPDLWKSYYPHETFLKLIDNLTHVLRRAAANWKLNVWVEGAYGTGKSHAVLTLQHLLTEPEDIVRAYFAKYKVSDETCQNFLTARRPLPGYNPIVVASRYASQSIHSPNDLFLALQESISKAVTEAGGVVPLASLRESVIKYLEDDDNRQAINIFVLGSYRTLFGGKDVDTMLSILRRGDSDECQGILRDLNTLGNERNISIFKLGVNDMKSWIAEVIDVNKLKALVFIWDEFSDYFNHNQQGLGDFQAVMELSLNKPFCFIPVTHQSAAQLTNTDTGKIVLDRFVSPRSMISMPENIAFRLMAEAMRHTDDAVREDEWKDISGDLASQTKDVRKNIETTFGNIAAEDMRKVLPLHPYAALLLKQLSVDFGSNQRSMFTFIKGEDDNDDQSFQWYIHNYGPRDTSHSLLTVDFLWKFFYERGREALRPETQHILAHYDSIKGLTTDEQRVMKALLLLMALYVHSGRSVTLFCPNDANLNAIFSGTDWDSGKAASLAHTLVKKNVIHEAKLNGKPYYTISTATVDTSEVDKLKSALNDSTTTTTLLTNSKMSEAGILWSSLRLRVKLTYVTVTDVLSKANNEDMSAQEDRQHFHCLVCVAKNDTEAIEMQQKIIKYISTNPGTALLFYCLSEKDTVLGASNFASWVEATAYAQYHNGKDNNESKRYKEQADKILTQWRSRVETGAGHLYYAGKSDGEWINNNDTFNKKLRSIDAQRFDLALEVNYNSNDNWWNLASLDTAVGYGMNRETKGIFNSKNANLGTQLAPAWTYDGEYWREYPTETISKIKSHLETFIGEEMAANNGRVTFRAIYDYLSSEPIGFLPCAMTAFFIGFLLKEYANDNYSYSNSNTPAEPMTQQKMKEAVKEIIEYNGSTTVKHYTDKYLIRMTEETKVFLRGTATAFGLTADKCSSVEAARNNLCGVLRNGLTFPLWTLHYVLTTRDDIAEKEAVATAIDMYIDYVHNTSGKAVGTLAGEIAALFMSHSTLPGTLRTIITVDGCREGMTRYLAEYREALLPRLAQEINDGGQYLHRVRERFTADATWLWEKVTVNEQIDYVITEYTIAAKTRQLLGKGNSYSDAIQLWRTKIASIKISYYDLLDEVQQIKPLLTLLKDIATSTLDDRKKGDFVTALDSCGEEFNKFYAHQEGVFKNVCKYHLRDLTPEDIHTIFTSQMPDNLFVLDKPQYDSRVRTIVTQYKDNLGRTQLRKLWTDKTNTKTPKEWSSQHKMPIITLFSDDEESARQAFNTINNDNPSNSAVTTAMEWLEKNDIWSRLKDDALLEKAFREKVLKDEGTLIDNIDDIKKHLSNNSDVTPYNWKGSDTITSLVQEYAQDKYNNGGYEKALQRIDAMPEATAKEFLKELIKNNMTVGIQIIKSLP